MAAKKKSVRLNSRHLSPTVTLTAYQLFLNHLETGTETQGAADSDDIRED
jgi:hypothetical protein